MRQTLAFSLVLLGVVLALEHARALRPRSSGAAADRALEIVVGAKGPLLPAATLGSGPERVGPVLRLGDRTLPTPGPHGLQVAVVGADSELRAHRLYDVAHVPADADALAEAVAERHPGELLVLASRGRIRPEGSASDVLARAMTRIGARAPLGEGPRESWALLALRAERGWVPLAEAYSDDSGVALAFVLGADRERYAGFVGDRVRVRARERQDVELVAELPYASSRTPGVTVAHHRTVQGQPLDALLVPPRVSADGRPLAGEVVWEGVTVGTGSCVTALLGLADDARGESDGVVFRVLFDGELVHARTILPGSRWKRTFFDLRPLAGRTGTLTLAVDPRDSAAGDDALFGLPLLLHGYERSPLEVWAEEL